MNPKSITAMAVAALFAIFSGKAEASNLKIGMRGPTETQLEANAFYSKNEKGAEAQNYSLKFKYWDGKGEKFGKWGFVNIPYKWVETPAGSNYGLGDITIAAGPRGDFGDFHFHSHAGLTLPTGETKSDVPLGNGRYDASINGLATYILSKNAAEIDASLSYTITGENNSGQNPPNVLSGGLLAGGEITDAIRLVGGVTGKHKDNGDYVINARGVGRLTISKDWHAQVIGDWTAYSREIPKGESMGVQFRYNFEF
ncbi:hypothetical protein ACFL0W_02615 [Nanoarchaeota archaeon]